MLKRTSVLAAMAGLAMGPAVLASDVNWMNPSGGFFNTTTNWSPTQPPGSTDRAVFNRSSSYQVIFTTNITNSMLRVADDAVTFNLAGKTYSATSATGDSLSIGGAINAHGATADNGVLTLISGPAGAVFNTATAAIGGTGTLGSGGIVVSSDVTWNSSGVIAVGSGSAGTLQVQSGGDISGFMGIVGADAVGTASVNGAGSTWINSASLDIGGSKTGTLNVQNGGFVRDTTASLGVGAGITGTAVVTGTNSQWLTPGQFIVGMNGTGSITSTFGGRINAGGTAGTCTVADGIGSHGILNASGTGSMIVFNSGPTQIGRQGLADVTIQAAGALDMLGNVYFAPTTFGSANVLVTGNGSRLSTGSNVYVGGASTTAAGPATVTIEPGASMILPSNGLLKIWGPGTVNLAGGTLRLLTLTVAGGVFNWTSGTLQFLGPMSVATSGPLGATPFIGAQKTIRAVGFQIDGNATPTLSINGGTMVSEAGLIVGQTGSGALGLTAGATSSTYGFTLGAQAGATGIVTVDGGSIWGIGAFPDNQDVYVGAGGTGVVNITNGGRAIVAYNIMDIGNDAGSHGTVTVSGSGSELVYGEFYGLSIGRFGTGTLRVLAGAQVFAPAIIAEQPGAVGTVLVSGTDSLWSAKQLNLGSAGVGTLNVESGGQVLTGDLYTTQFAGSSAQVTIRGTQSSLTAVEGAGAFGQVIVGGNDQATMLIEQGADVDCVESFIGDGSTGIGTVTVRDTGSVFHPTHELDVAYNGNGTLMVQAGGSVTTDAFSAGFRNNSHGETTVDGSGSSLNTNSMVIGGGQLGKLTVSNGGSAHADTTATVNPTGSIVLATGTFSAATLALNGGSLSGNGSVAGGVTNAGLITPGSSTGVIAIQGTYTQAAGGVLNAEVAGTLPGPQHDQLAVSGAVTLGGTLNVSFFNGYQPRDNESFTILNGASISGTFSTVKLPPIPGGRLQVVYGPTSVSIVHCYVNCDGSSAAPILNANDFQCFLNKFASADPYANCDGSSVAPILNANDFQCFLNKFAAGCT